MTGRHITREEARAFYEPIRAAFEAGGDVETLAAQVGRDRAALYAAARRLGWDCTNRRGPRSLTRTGPSWNAMRVEGDTLTCQQCSEERPLKAFTVGGRLRTICRRCTKANARRRKGARTVAEIRASAPPRTKREPTTRQLRAQLRTLLGKLFEQRCAEAGEYPSSISYRVRYRTDDAFRAREIARRWATKERQRAHRVPTDGTLDSATLCRLFAEATHCPYCTQPMRSQDKTLDHIIPVSRGGLHSITNVCVCCRACNTRKHARTPEEWRSGDRRPRSIHPPTPARQILGPFDRKIPQGPDGCRTGLCADVL